MPDAELKRARALSAAGYSERTLGNRAGALQDYGEAASIYRAEGDALRLAHTVRHLGDIHREDGRLDLAEPCYDEAWRSIAAMNEPRL